MQALVKTGPGAQSVGLRDVPEPGPLAPGHVLLRVIAVGICGTDLHIIADEFPSSPPVVMGHEVAGVVEEVGEGVDTALIGARVAVETYFTTCGVCEPCRAGRRNLCGQRRSIGSHVNGGFAPLLVVPRANVHRVDDRVSDAAAALYEPLACVAHCLCDPPLASPGDTGLVVGPGTMGLLTAQVLASQGVQVTVSGTRSDAPRLEAARDLGLATVYADELASAVPADGYDIVAECSGSGPGIGAALNAVRKGGRYVQIGLGGHPVEFDIDLVCLKEVALSSGFASVPQSWYRASRLVASGLVALDPLVSSVQPLSQWHDAFEQTRRGEGVKFVIDPRERSHGTAV
ncbi:zinc-dependent alcohol dehydrogenase [Streptomyces sp. NPDC001177]